MKNMDNDLSSKIRMQLKLNVKYVRLMNYFSMLDTRFPTIHDENSLRFRTYLDLIRFFILFIIGIKLTLLTFLNGSLPSFRYYIMDWTALNPSMTGSHQIRFMMTLCFLGLCMKRNLFFKSTLHAGILEFLIEDPRDLNESCKLSRYNKSDSQSMNSIKNDAKYSESSDKLCNYVTTSKFFGRRYWLDPLKRYINLLMGLPSQCEPKEAHQYKLTRKDFHTLQNWLKLSRDFVRSFKLTCLLVCCTHGGTVVYGCIRVLFFSRRPPECMECTESLRLVALIETFIVYSEGILCTMGLLTQVHTVVIYLTHQATWTKTYLTNYITSLDKSHHSNHLISREEDIDEHRVMLQTLQSNSLINTINSHDAINYDTKLHHTTDSMGTRTETVSRVHKKLFVNSLHRHPTSDYLKRTDIIATNHKSNPISSSISLNEDSSVDPKTATNKREFASIKYDQDHYHELEVCRKRVLDLLYSFDEQKPLITFMVTIKYISLFSKITTIPLLLTISRLGFAIAQVLVGYIVAGFFTSIICLKIAIDCANVNYATLDVGKLMFSICARYPGQPIQMHWSRIYYNWYLPIRCVFKVANFFELTYLNIVKTVSYAISAVTLYLNYLNRFY